MRCPVLTSAVLYRPTHSLCDLPASCAIALRARYAVSGTDMRYALPDLQSKAAREWGFQYRVRPPHRATGSLWDVRYTHTVQCPVLTSAMLLPGGGDMNGDNVADIVIGSDSVPPYAVAMCNRA
eukprot:1847475-Rhodomonas_salina.6